MFTRPSAAVMFGFVSRMSLPSSVRAGRLGTFHAAAQRASAIEKLV